mmetsp:Transcript_2860/g.6078  ORF Transcript_2860/g.6078 Transcript_2860/m.6078 type:complete len:104 (-) Transcript_2860:27-338(-)
MWDDPDSTDLNYAGTDVDVSSVDHYFWFGPGKQEYTIEGFYETPITEKQFVFGEPSRKRSASGEPTIVLEEASKMGCIRIQFCRVSEFKNRRRRDKSCCVTLD